jgi:hypothetical protein
MPRSYRYDAARTTLKLIEEDLRVLAGDTVGPSGLSWQQVADRLAVLLRAYAEMLDDARAGRVDGGPVVFPSPDDLGGDHDAT